MHSLKMPLRHQNFSLSLFLRHGLLVIITRRLHQKGRCEQDSNEGWTVGWKDRERERERDRRRTGWKREESREKGLFSISLADSRLLPRLDVSFFPSVFHKLIESVQLDQHSEPTYTQKNSHTNMTQPQEDFPPIYAFSEFTDGKYNL